MNELQDEFKYFIENCTKSPKSFDNYNSGLTSFVTDRLKELVPDFKGIFSYTSSREIEEFQKILSGDEEFKKRDQGNSSKMRYSNSLSSYLMFLKAREYFHQGNKSTSSVSTTTLDSRQVIWYGAPGTGKSHGVKEETEAWEKVGRVVRTTFHPDSDYSTFVGAYKPTTQLMPRYDMYQNPIIDKATKEPVMEQVITYEFVPQAFLQAYVDAWLDQSKPEYLVIEEINRGNCAQIFGDLFQLLDRGEDGYSEYAIRADRDLQKYLVDAFADAEIDNANIKDGTLLKLPPNLYIRATMNTSDQSLFPIDSAFKRRWDWKYIPIRNAALQWTISAGDTRYDWWDFVSKINKRIFDATNSEDKQLGYFFCKAKDGVIGTDAFVGKVIFYLWNDVFRDFGFDGPIFNDKDDADNPKLSFDKFYTPNGKPKAEIVKKFMENLGVIISSETNVASEEYNGQDESTDNTDADRQEWSETEKKRFEFWTEFLNYAQQNTEFAKYFGGIKKASKDHWKNFFIKGEDFYLVILQQRQKSAIEVQCYFNETNQAYHNLLAHKEEIEQEMQVKYEWNELPEKKSSNISDMKFGVDYDNEASRKDMFDFCIDRLLRMREVFPKYSK